MTTWVAVLRRWLARPATTFAGRGFVYLPLFVAGPLALLAGLYYLATGQLPGGRAAAAGIVVFGAVCAAVWRAMVRATGRMLHVVVGLALVPGLDVVDTWVKDGRLGSSRFPGYPLLVAAGLLYNLGRFAWRERAGRRAEPVAASADVA